MHISASSQLTVEGVVPVIPTPFDQNEEVDIEALERLVEFAVVTGLKTICLPMYGSEFYKLNESEKNLVVETAVRQARGRILVIAQSGHNGTRGTIEIAQKNESVGADLISFTLPRLMPLSEEDLLRYSEQVASSVRVPVLIQDWNPAGGPTVGADFCRRLHESCPNFRYIKLEEPMMGTKTEQILKATNGEVGVLEGWGGLYLMELISRGICGLMPGLAVADILSRVFKLAREGHFTEALDIYQVILPQIVFALKNMEFFNLVEKQILRARGLLTNAICREPTMRLDKETIRYIQILASRINDLLERIDLPRNPVS